MCNKEKAFPELEFYSDLFNIVRYSSGNVQYFLIGLEMVEEPHKKVPALSFINLANKNKYIHKFKKGEVFSDKFEYVNFDSLPEYHRKNIVNFHDLKHMVDDNFKIKEFSLNTRIDTAIIDEAIRTIQNYPKKYVDTTIPIDISGGHIFADYGIDTNIESSDNCFFKPSETSYLKILPFFNPCNEMFMADYKAPTTSNTDNVFYNQHDYINTGIVQNSEIVDTIILKSKKKERKIIRFRDEPAIILK